MAIFVYNINNETHSGENNYIIMRPSILSNPYTHIKDRKTLAKFVVKTRDESIKLYNEYFDIMYKSNIPFKEKIDEIYEKYKSGTDVYLGCCCKPLPCHGDIIKNKLQNRLVKEKIQKLTNK